MCTQPLQPNKLMVQQDARGAQQQVHEHAHERNGVSQQNGATVGHQILRKEGHDPSLTINNPFYRFPVHCAQGRRHHAAGPSRDRHQRVNTI